MSKLPGLATEDHGAWRIWCGTDGRSGGAPEIGRRRPDRAGWLGVSRLEHLGHRSVHADRSGGRFETLDLHVVELVEHELRRDLGGSVSRLSIAADGDREHPALSGPVHARRDRLVGDEAGHLLQPRRELLVHPVHELVDALRADAVVAHACVHRSSTSVGVVGPLASGAADRPYTYCTPDYRNGSEAEGARKGALTDLADLLDQIGQAADLSPRPGVGGEGVSEGDERMVLLSRRGADSSVAAREAGQ